MEGRRVTRRNRKYNPLFILFLCLVASVLVLLIVSIVLGIRLGSANKKLKTAEAKIEELTQNVVELNDELSSVKESDPTPTDPPLPNEPALPGVTDPTQSAVTGGDSWLDLTGHSEVEVPPTKLLDSYAVYYTTAGVNLRSGPSTSNKRITTVDYGEKVQVAAQQDNWSFVRVGNKFGWINSDYLSTSQPASHTHSSSNSNSGSRSESTSGSIRP